MIDRSLAHAAEKCQKQIGSVPEREQTDVYRYKPALFELTGKLQGRGWG